MSRVKKIMICLPNSLLDEVDRIAAAEKLSRSEFIREGVKMYIEDRKRQILIEQMKKGYLEMANINLALAIEHYRLESEVTQKFDLPVTEVK
ncbi:MAG: ribbon-helix-helix protein, CopG family [Desulfotomaculaceae bacterium]|nr:ribbon-helix-helix protein, CopG family [Desulfotomaculaceae bacterium]